MAHTLEGERELVSMTLVFCKILAITVHDVSRLTMKPKNRV